MTEELLGQLMLELARKEGHRPMHLIGPGAAAQAEAGKRKSPRGEMGARVRELAEQGLTLKQVADALGLAAMTVHGHGKRQGITFRQEPLGKNFKGRAA